MSAGSGDERDAPRSRSSWQELRARLDAVGFRPSRRLGQNFLVDPNAARAIARDARVGAGDVVLEVGVGPGLLTVPLLEQGIERLVAVEIDARLLEVAREAVGDDARVQWIHADVLAGKQTLAPEVEAALPRDRPWHLASNLPYSVSGPLIAVLAEREPPPSTMTVLVQREVAERLLAAPATAAWGPLAVVVGLGYRGRTVRELAPELFRPRPQVWSTLVRLEADPAAPPREDRARVARLARALFQHRRQTLGRAVARLAGPEPAAAALAAAGVDAGVRAETLGLGELRALAAALPPIGR